jgi:transcriptional regulator with XRE-family HTH domain
VIFDAEGLAIALDKKRTEKSMSWRAVARETGVSPSTLSRLAADENPDVRGLVALLAWLGQTDLAPYLRAA